jgi:hypothetical protein
MASERQVASLLIMKNMQPLNGLPEHHRPRKDKFGIAAHFDVGVRTIENWLARGIISAQRKGKKLEFNVDECDRRLSVYKA